MHWLLKCRLLCQFGGRVASHLISKLTRLKRRSLQIVLLGLALLLLQTSLTAAPLVKRPLAPPNTSSPQATLSSFVENVNRAHEILMAAHEQSQQESGLFYSDSVQNQVKQGRIIFRRATDCLNLSEVPPRLKKDTGIEATLLLKEILDRIKVPLYSEIPDAKAVAANQELSRWTIPGTQINIVKAEDGPKVGKFLFSPRTVNRLREFYKQVEQLPYKPDATEGFYEFYISTPASLAPSTKLDQFFLDMPDWLNTRYGDQTLWQWIILWISFVITIGILYGSLRWNLWRAAALVPPQRTWVRLVSPLIALACSSALHDFLGEWVNITGDLLLIVSIGLEIIWWMLILLTLVLLSNALAETIIASPKINSKGLDAGAIRIVFRLSSLTLGIVVLILGLERVGIALAPLLTGLGIGGAALALAARPTLENIFGGLTLFADRPVRVGDFCRFGEKMGTVEEIGLRSTRIRGIDRTVISVPNAEFSHMELVNFSQRDRILLETTIGLRYETTSEQLRFVLVKLREMILAHPKLLEDSSQVRFVKYGDYSLDVEIYVYADTRDPDEFLGIQEDVLLRVKDIVEAAGTGFAVPSQRNYLSRDSGVDRERSYAAEAEVQAWRAKGVLPFPEFSPEQREHLRDTLDFPPEGSPNGRPASANGDKGD